MTKDMDSRVRGNDRGGGLPLEFILNLILLDYKQSVQQNISNNKIQMSNQPQNPNTVKK